MSQANKALLQRWIEEVWNQKSEAAIEELLSSSGKCYGFPDDDSALVGPEAFKQVHRTFLGAMPDLKITIDEIIAEGDLVALRWSVTGTHLGDHFGFAASNKPAKFTGSSFAIVKDGQIQEGRNYMDMGGLMQKLQTN